MQTRGISETLAFQHIKTIAEIFHMLSGKLFYIYSILNPKCTVAKIKQN